MCCQDEIVFPRLNGEVADSYGWKVVALKLRPIFPSVDGNEKPKFGAKKKQIGLDDIFLNYVRIPTNLVHP